MAKSTGPTSAKKNARRRSPGEGSVYPFRGGHAGALAWTDPDGTRHRRTVTAPTSAGVRDKLDDLRRELRLGTLTSASQALTVGDYLTEWIERHRTSVRPSTWRSAEQHVRVYLIPALGRIPLARLSADDVATALAAFQATGRPVRAPKRTRGRQNAGGLSPLTVRHIRATLRQALGAAVIAGKAQRNAAADSRPPYLPHRPITYLSTRDLARLLDATRDDEFGPLYALAATTGLRLGELLGLEWPDVADGRLTVRRSLARAQGNGWELAQPKSARSRRTIPLPARARQAVETQRTRQRFAQNAAGSAWQDRDGLVFTDAVGRPLAPERVSREFGKARDAAGVPRIRFHDLRHSAATALLSAGVPLAVISEWLGHSGIAITASAYAAVVPELLTDAADAMDRALGGDS